MILVLINWILFVGYISTGVVIKYDFYKMLLELFMTSVLVCVIRSDNFPSLLTTNATLGNKINHLKNCKKNFQRLLLTGNI